MMFYILIAVPEIKEAVRFAGQGENISVMWHMAAAIVNQNLCNFQLQP